MSCNKQIRLLNLSISTSGGGKKKIEKKRKSLQKTELTAQGGELPGARRLSAGQAAQGAWAGNFTPNGASGGASAAQARRHAGVPTGGDAGSALGPLVSRARHSTTRPPNRSEGHCRANFRVLGDWEQQKDALPGLQAGWGSLPLPTLLRLPLACLLCGGHTCTDHPGQTSACCPQPAWAWGLSPPPWPTLNQIPLFPPKLLLHPSFAVFCMQGHPRTALAARGGEENSFRRTEGHGCFPTCKIPVPPGSRGTGLVDPSEHSRQHRVFSLNSGQVLGRNWRASHALLLSTSKGATCKEPHTATSTTNSTPPCSRTPFLLTTLGMCILYIICWTFHTLKKRVGVLSSRVGT